jgi:hypothetical protein
MGHWGIVAMYGLRLDGLLLRVDWRTREYCGIS